MELNKEMVIAEFQSLLHIAKFTDSDFITSPFRKEFLEYAISLIKELTEENARLQTDYNELYESTTEEIKRLSEDNEDLKAQCRYYAEAYHSVKADTLRKLKEILAENYVISEVPYVDGEEPTVTYQLTNWDLRTVEKKVLEGE